MPNSGENNKNKDKVAKKYYAVEFRKRGRQPITRIMDVVATKWFTPSAAGEEIDLRVRYPENAHLASVE